jgi:hypothetical protein
VSRWRDFHIKEKPASCRYRKIGLSAIIEALPGDMSMLAFLRHLKLTTRLYALTMGMLLGLLALGALSVFELRQQVLQEKRLAIRAVVSSAMGVLQEQYDLQQAGKLTQDEAQRLAKDALRKSRFNGDDYLFIYDFSGTTMMHGARPEREGKNTLDATDPTGKTYIKDWIELLQRNGEAKMDYLFAKPGADKPIAKIAYAKVFAPWGWWLATGCIHRGCGRRLLAQRQQQHCLRRQWSAHCSALSAGPSTAACSSRSAANPRWRPARSNVLVRGRPDAGASPRGSSQAGQPAGRAGDHAGQRLHDVVRDINQGTEHARQGIRRIVRRRQRNQPGRTQTGRIQRRHRRFHRRADGQYQRSVRDCPVTEDNSRKTADLANQGAERGPQGGGPRSRASPFR